MTFDFFTGHPRWAHEPGFNPRVQGAITAALKAIRRDRTVSGFHAAHAHLNRYVTWEMSPRQRMAMRYILGMSYNAMGAHGTAIGLFAEALDLAYRLADYDTAAHVAHLLGSTHHMILQVDQAIRYYVLCLTMLRGVSLASDSNATVSSASQLEYATLVDLAGMTTFLARFDEATAWQHQAEHLLRNCSMHGLQEANFHWNSALIERWQGDLWGALKHAERACEVYAAVGARSDFARAQVVAADIAIDLAETLPPGSSARDEIIRTADCYLEDAPENALADEDPAAMGLAMLAEARLLRVAGVNENRTTPIIIVAQTARQFHDEALEGQAYTTLAHELFAQGEYGSARAVYTQALGAFRAKGLDALAIAPHRGIARIDMWYAGGYSAGV